MDVEKFIKCVKVRDEIYNKSNPNYKYRDAVIDAWRGIAREMNISVIECKEKWHNLRSNYMRERKKVLSPGVRKWHLLDSLKFLEPHHCVRLSQSRRRSSRKHSIHQESFIIQEFDDCELPSLHLNTTKIEEIQQEILQQNSNSNHNAILPPMNRTDSHHFPEVEQLSPKQTRKKSKYSKSDDRDSEYLREVRKLSRHLTQPTEDPDRMFLLSLMPMVKQLSPRENIDFRVEVQQMLQRKLYEKFDNYLSP